MRTRPLQASLAAVGIVVASLLTSGCTPPAEARTIRIGIKFDQPGLALKQGSTYSGLDVDVARYVARTLGRTPEFIEARSAQREVLVTSGQVELVLGSYSITPGREQKVDFAGPYFVAGQDLMVAKADTSITGPGDLVGRRLCTAMGSTAAQTIKDRYPGVLLRETGTLSECVTDLSRGVVDAVTTDDVVLAGYRSRPAVAESTRIVGKPFSTERYGIGLRKGDTALCAKVTSALEDMISSGAWATAVDRNLVSEGFHPRKGNPPKVRDCA